MAGLLALLVVGSLGCDAATHDVTGTWSGGMPDYGITLNLQQAGDSVHGSETVMSNISDGPETFPIFSGTYFRPQLTLWTSYNAATAYTVVGENEMIWIPASMRLTRE